MNEVWQAAHQTKQYDDSCVMAIDTHKQKALVFLKQGVRYTVDLDKTEALYYEQGQFWPVDKEYLRTIGVL